MSCFNGYTREEKLIRTSAVASLSFDERKIPTFSFTEAVRNLDLERLQQRVESEATEIIPAVTKDYATEYEHFRDYMDDHLEDLCIMQIQDTLEQFCGLANETLENEQLFGIPGEILDADKQLFVTDELLAAEEELLYRQAIKNALCVKVPLDENEWLHLKEGNNILSPVYEESWYKQEIKRHSIYEEFFLNGQVPAVNTNWSQCEGKTSSMIKSMEESHIKETNDSFVGKRRLCRHFLKGGCNRGSSCDFLHDESIFCTDEQKVFLGGLPPFITDKILQRALKKQGYKVLNKPKVLQGFSPQICLSSVQEAQEMIRKGKIVIKGTWVDVRPYEAFAKDSLKAASENQIKRSIFLGGLPSSTTGWMIKERLAQLGFKTACHPVVKSGFAPQVMLESVEQARKLVKLKKLKINKSIVEVRPYSRYRMQKQI